MTDRPIIFSGPMVRALLEGRKTQTRRILKPQPPPEATSAGTYWTSWEGATNRWTWLTGDPRDCDTWEYLNSFNAPYAVGDRLWVRETWSFYENILTGSYAYTEGQTPTYPPHYVKDGARHEVVHRAGKENSAWGMYGEPKWRPSIHMPRTVSRITLTVEAVKVERLQDISEEDAVAEGVERDDGGHGLMAGYSFKCYDNPGYICFSAVESFKSLWQSLNAKRAPWDSNPWVVAVTFNVIKANIDSLKSEAA